MIFELFDQVLEFALGGGAQTTVILALAVGMIYFRKAIGLGSVLADWTGKIVFSLGVLLVLLLTGVIPGIDVAAAQSLITTIFDLALSVLDYVT